MKKIFFLFLLFCFLFSAVEPADAFWFFGKKEAKLVAVSETPKEPVTPKIVEAPKEEKVEVPTLTLKKAYHLSLKQSEEIARRVQEMGIAQGHVYQALGVILPKVDYFITHFEQDVSGEPSSSGGSSSNSFRRTTPQQKITFSQPIFSGFKEFAAIQGAGAEKAQRHFEIQKAKETLFIDVTEAFYAVLQSQKDVTTLLRIRVALAKRNRDIKKRVEVGRSREGESLSAYSDLLLVETDLDQARRTLRLSKELLGFYIGKDVTETLLDEPLPTTSFSDLSFYTAKALNRSEVKAAENARTLAEKKVVVAQSGLFPAVTLDGNYYTKRVGFQNGNDWDLLLTVDVPIFNRLDTFGDIRVAASEKDQAVATYQETRRKAKLEIKNAYDEFVTSRAIEERLSRATTATQKDYDFHRKEYETDLVSNLDVLDALRRYEEAELRRNTAYYNFRKNFWKLKIAVGELPADPIEGEK